MQKQTNDRKQQLLEIKYIYTKKKKMKITTPTQAGLKYNDMIRGGGIATYEGKPWLQEGGGISFGAILKPLINVVKKPLLGLAKNLLSAIPGIGARGLKELGPGIAAAGISAAADAIANKKNLGQSIKESMLQQKAEILKKGKNIIKEEGLKAMMKGRGRKRKTPCETKQIKTKKKKLTTRKQNRKKTIFDPK